MKKINRSYEPHLVLREISLRPGEEWTPQFSGWTLIQVGTGTAYWMQPKLNQELVPGMVLLISARVAGTIRASQLDRVSLFYFPVQPSRLIGLFTFSEHRFFDLAASKEQFAVRILPPDSPIAVKVMGLCANRNSQGPSFRLQLLQVFFEVFGNDFKVEAAQPKTTMEAKERLREFLQRTPTSELLNMTCAELAQMMRCTPRHLSRIFYEVVGVSFRENHTELRLARARELLATTQSKIVDVAMESGYPSLSLFNAMFTRRFGMSPGRWRQEFGKGNATLSDRQTNGTSLRQRGGVEVPVPALNE
ncbi:MAG: AraC family transcriptional regulator [Verrucomicrobiota bacterium]|nr:AraC family transcriptional regulator [Verrucomicrobiota bacterium]